MKTSIRGLRERCIMSRRRHAEMSLDRITVTLLESELHALMEVAEAADALCRVNINAPAPEYTTLRWALDRLDFHA